MSTGRYFHQAVLLASGQVLAVGGFEPTVTGQLASVDAYDAGTNSWSQAAAMNTSRDAHTATVLPSGQVLVAGGYGSNGGLASAELFAGAPNITSTISGLIADASNTPIVGVSVSYGAGDASITQSDGTYQISGLVPGSYTLMPSKPGYTFSPPSRAVTVPPDAMGVDFIATPTGSESWTGKLHINEMLPLPGSGQHQWVEFYRPRTPYFLYLPLVMRGTGSLTYFSTAPVGGQSSAPADTDISGWHLVNKAGQGYAIPEALPPLPEEVFVLVYFDGLGPGANDYDFSDGLVVLHTPAGLVDTFDPTADQVALYASATHNAQTIRDFLAYGGPPGEGANDAIVAGLWQTDWWVELYIGSGAVAEGEAVAPDLSIGLYPARTNLSPEDWAVYTAADLTPGAANPVPRSTWSAADNGEVMASDGFALGWAFVPDATYQLQIDDDSAFGSPLVDVLLSQPYYQPQVPPPGGDYWWRARGSRRGTSRRVVRPAASYGGASGRRCW